MRDTTFWPTIGKMGVGEMGAGEQGISPFSPPPHHLVSRPSVWYTCERCWPGLAMRLRDA